MFVFVFFFVLKLHSRFCKSRRIMQAVHNKIDGNVERYRFHCKTQNTNNMSHNKNSTGQETQKQKKTPVDWQDRTRNLSHHTFSTRFYEAFAIAGILLLIIVLLIWPILVTSVSVTLEPVYFFLSLLSWFACRRAGSSWSHL